VWRDEGYGNESDRANDKLSGLANMMTIDYVSLLSSFRQAGAGNAPARFMKT